MKATQTQTHTQHAAEFAQAAPRADVTTDVPTQRSHLTLAHEPIPALIPDTRDTPEIKHDAAVSDMRPYLRAVPDADPDTDHAIFTLPHPRHEMIGRVALQAYEVLEGTRSLAQLGNLVSFELSQRLAEMRSTRQLQQQVYRDQRYCAPRCGSIRVCTIRFGVLEAAVVLHTQRRSHAVAMRLEWAHRRWRASDLAVL